MEKGKWERKKKRKEKGKVRKKEIEKAVSNKKEYGRKKVKKWL